MLAGAVSYIRRLLLLFKFPLKTQIKMKTPQASSRSCCMLLWNSALEKLAFRLWWVFFPAGTKEHPSLNCRRGSWSDCRNRPVGLTVFHSKDLQSGVRRNLLHLGTDRRDSKQNLGLVWGTLMQAHLWETCLAEFREICPWERQGWPWKELEVSDLQQCLSIWHRINWSTAALQSHSILQNSQASRVSVSWMVKINAVSVGDAHLCRWLV